MTNQNETQGKFLINCQDGANNVERATISCILAVIASKTSETAMFVSAEAAQLGVKGGTDGMIAKAMNPLRVCWQTSSTTAAKSGSALIAPKPEASPNLT